MCGINLRTDVGGGAIPKKLDWESLDALVKQIGVTAACKILGIHRSWYYRNLTSSGTGEADAPRIRGGGRWILDDNSQRARLRELVDQHPGKGRRALAKLLVSEHGPSEATIGKFLREEGLSQNSQRLPASGQDPASSKPRLGEVLYVARLPYETEDISSRTMLFGIDQASAYAFIACDADSLSESLEKLIGESSKILDRVPDMVILDRNGDRYFKIPKAAEDFAKGRGISIRLEGRWGKNLLAHRKRLEALWNQARLPGDGAGSPEDWVANRYNYKEPTPLPPCSGRTPIRTLLDFRKGRASGSNDRL